MYQKVELKKAGGLELRPQAGGVLMKAKGGRDQKRQWRCSPLIGTGMLDPF